MTTDAREQQVVPLLEEQPYKPSSAADYIITFHWDKDGATVPDADKEVYGAEVIGSCFVHLEETKKVFKNLWRECGELKDKSKKVKLSVLRTAVLNDFREWLPSIGFTCTAFKSLDKDELFMRISLEGHTVQQFYAEMMKTMCQLNPETVKKLKIAYPEGTRADECSPPYIAYEDGMDAEQSKKFGMSSVFRKDYKLRDTSGSLLRQVDRIRIIRKTIMRLIDLEDLTQTGIISGRFPCHILAPLEDFRDDWASFSVWKLFGCFAEQPLLRIRNYFGEQVGFYFAWLNLTIRRLLILGVVGVAWRIAATIVSMMVAQEGGCKSSCFGPEDARLAPMEMCQFDSNSTNTLADCGGCTYCSHLGPQGYVELVSQLGFGLVVGMWATGYSISWKRTEYALMVQWEMQNASERAALRADFRGEMLESPLNANEVMKQFPKKWIQIYKVFAAVTNVFVVILSVTAIFASRGLENMFTGMVCPSHDAQGRLCRPAEDSDEPRGDCADCTYGKTCVSILIAVEIQVFNAIWQIIARKLVILENPRTEAEYGNALINKLAPFGLITTYNTFVFIAMMQHVGHRVGNFWAGCAPNPTETWEDEVAVKPGDCLAYLQVSLFTTFATQAALVVVSMAIPFLLLWWSLKKEAKAIEEKYIAEGKEVPQRCFMEKQAKMGVYDQDAQITDYMSCITVLGYVVLFGAAVPSSAFIALFVLLFQFRANAYKLVRLCRRPYPVLCNGIGSWNNIIDTLGWIGLIFYVGVPILNSPIMEHYPSQTKLLLLFLAEHAVIIVKVIMGSFFSLQPKESLLLVERRRYVKDALLIGKDDPEGLKEELKKPPLKLSKETVKSLNETSEEWGSIDKITPLISPLVLLKCQKKQDTDEDEFVPKEETLAKDRDDFV